MTYIEIRLLDNYGTYNQVYKLLHGIASHVAVQEERVPYLHLHCCIKLSKDMSLVQIRKWLYTKPHTPFIRKANNIHVDGLRYGLRAYMDYMIKQNGDGIADWDYETLAEHLACPIGRMNRNRMILNETVAPTPISVFNECPSPNYCAEHCKKYQFTDII